MTRAATRPELLHWARQRAAFDDVDQLSGGSPKFVDRAGFDFCLAFGEWLNPRSATARVASIDKVGGELPIAADDPSDTEPPRPSAFFLPTRMRFGLGPSLGAV